jgi:accessory gene regulator B
LLRFNLTRPAAAFLRARLDLTPEEEEIARFGLQIILYTITGFFSIIVVGWLLGCMWTTVTVALTAAYLRLLSGGAHSRSPLTCNIIGMAVAPLLGKTAAITAPFLTSLTLFLAVAAGFVLCLNIVSRLSPVDSPAKPITSSEQRRRLRFLSLLSVLLVTVGQFVLLAINEAPALVLAASLGLWWQTFTLTEGGHRFATFMDNLKERR